MHTIYNVDLALYDPASGHLPAEERMPSELSRGKTYGFVKPGHRNYLPEVPVTLLEIKKDDVLFHMKAQVQVTDVRFEIREGKSYTVGTYVVRELLKD